MRFTIYVAKQYESDFRRFVKSQPNPSRRICNIVSTDLSNLNINELRSVIAQNPDERRKVKELLNEFETV